MPDDQVFTTKEAPIPRGPYVHARKHGGLVWVTGQIGRDPESGDFVRGGFEAEFNQAIDNLEAILEAAGSSLDRVVRTQIEFVNESDLDAMNRIYGERFRDPLPARTSFGVAFLWKGAKVQIDCVAAAD
ncbi:MAG TPA: Rid family hydrolase [Candidatus Dormibacteraeota bacterium]|nr:Rid family hydrolase [Candidatus Dormibacteraeota bacterium]